MGCEIHGIVEQRTFRGPHGWYRSASHTRHAPDLTAVVDLHAVQRVFQSSDVAGEILQQAHADVEIEYKCHVFFTQHLAQERPADLLLHGKNALLARA